jgi:hypothetical protein
MPSLVAIMICMSPLSRLFSRETKRTREMYNRIGSLDRLHKRLADLEVARQAVERLGPICQIGFQCMHLRVIQRRNVDIEDIMAVGQKLVNYVSACYARTAGKDYPF